MQNTFKNSSPYIGLLVIWTLFVVLSGCSKSDQVETGVDSGRPVKTVVIQSIGLENTREFPGTVWAAQKADMAFRVSGKLNELPVREGDQVERGQVIATLDDTDFKIALGDSQASFTKAAADFKRAIKLLPDGHISRSDYDKLEAQHKTAMANLALSRQNLAYTTLEAPFPGTVAKRFVENHEEVNAKQKIVLLQDNSSLDISIDVPESLMIMIDRDKKDSGERRKVHAIFNAIKDRVFPLTFKEVVTNADIDTQTFKVTFTMIPPAGFSILPGMKATVIADSSGLEDNAEATLLPVSAVVADIDKQSIVWLVNEENMTVNPIVVQAGSMQRDSIEISGLKAGDRVVVTGVPFLRKGMKVSLLETGEQPE